MSNWGNKGISIAENARRQIDIIYNNTEQYYTSMKIGMMKKFRGTHLLYSNNQKLQLPTCMSHCQILRKVESGLPAKI